MMQPKVAISATGLRHALRTLAEVRPATTTSSFSDNNSLNTAASNNKKNKNTDRGIRHVDSCYRVVARNVRPVGAYEWPERFFDPIAIQKAADYVQSKWRNSMQPVEAEAVSCSTMCTAADISGWYQPTSTDFNSGLSSSEFGSGGELYNPSYQRFPMGETLASLEEELPGFGSTAKWLPRFNSESAYVPLATTADTAAAVGDVFVPKAASPSSVSLQSSPNITPQQLRRPLSADCRRHSVTGEELRSHLASRERTLRLLYRRRNSVDDSTFAMAALHAQEMADFREYQNPYATSSSYCPTTMRRSQSTLSISDTSTTARCVGGRSGGTGGMPGEVMSRLEKQRSLVSLTTPSLFNDSWPSSITQMLTGRQTVSDRLTLFYQLERLLTPQSEGKGSDHRKWSADSESMSTAASSSYLLNNGRTRESTYGFGQPDNQRRNGITSSINSTPNTPMRSRKELQQQQQDSSSSCGITCLPPPAAVGSVKSPLSAASTAATPSPRQNLIMSTAAADNNNNNAAAALTIPLRATNGLQLCSGGWTIARPDKRHRGEDAFFISDAVDGFHGVADGVGEWSELGSNPRLFAQELMDGAKRCSECTADSEQPANGSGGGASTEVLSSVCSGSRHAATSVASVYPRPSLKSLKLLQAGFDSTSSFGASTALVAGLDDDGRTLGVANLGDSGLIVFRRESRRHRHFSVCRRTKEQQHFFNCPYQLSRVPTLDDLPYLEKQGMYRLIRVLHSSSANLGTDTPDMADLYDIKLQQGDLIIAATDGLFDNLFDREVSSLVSLCLSPFEASILSRAGLARENKTVFHPDGISLPEYDKEFGYATPPTSIARAIAEAALYRSLDHGAKTPFASQSKRAGGWFVGGKMDDITVVASWVV